MSVSRGRLQAAPVGGEACIVEQSADMIEYQQQLSVQSTHIQGI